MNSNNAAGAMLSGPPYRPQVAQLGGVPSNSVDTPISAIFLFLFIVAGALHMAILRVNLKRDHRFIFSGLLFGLSMARIAALTMRIVWANRLTNVNIAIAASVFTNAGVIILFIVNILFAKRIIRGYHPHIGHTRSFDHVFSGLVFLIVAILFVLIGVSVSSFFTLDMTKRFAFRDIQRFAGVFFAVLAFLPIPLVLLAMALPKKTARPEKFGTGRWRTKLFLLLSTSALLTLGATFRAIVSFQTRPINDPAWYQSKACYYCFIFLIEIIVSFTYAGMRFDKRFHRPITPKKEGEQADERLERVTTFDSRINTEEAAFGGESAEEGYASAPQKAEQV